MFLLLSSIGLLEATFPPSRQPGSLVTSEQQPSGRSRPGSRLGATLNFTPCAGRASGHMMGTYG